MLDAYGAHAPVTTDEDADTIFDELAPPAVSTFTAIYVCLTGRETNAPVFLLLKRVAGARRPASSLLTCQSVRGERGRGVGRPLPTGASVADSCGYTEAEELHENSGGGQGAGYGQQYTIESRHSESPQRERRS